MNYNSSQALLAKLELEGKLFRFAPKMRRSLKRRLYLTAAAQREFQNPQSGVNILVGKGKIEAAMTLWVSGGLIYADLDEDKPLFLKNLSPPPPDIWEIRIYETSPQARLVGAFLEQDTFVVSGLHMRNTLGRKKSKAWANAMQASATDFGQLFGRAPMHGHHVGDYISENFDAFTL